MSLALADHFYFSHKKIKLFVSKEEYFNQDQWLRVIKSD